MMRALLRHGSGAIALALVLSAGVVWGQELSADEALERSAELLQDLRYEEARGVLMSAIRQGGIGADELTQVYFSLGMVEAGLDRAVEATDSFYMATLLSPQLVLPEGGSPRVRKYLDAARDRVVVVGALESRARVLNGSVVVSVTNDPVDMVERIRIERSYAEGEESSELVEPGHSSQGKRASVALAGAESVVVSLLDGSNNAVRVFELDSEADVAADLEGVRGGSWLTSWGLWAGAAVALAAGGGYYVMEASSSQADVDDLRSRPDPDALVIAGLQDDRDQAQLLGLAGLSLAGAAAVAAGVFFWDGRSERSHSSEVVFVPLVSPRGAGAQVQLSF